MLGKASLHDFREQRRLEKSVYATVQSGSQAEVEGNGFALLLRI